MLLGCFMFQEHIDLCVASTNELNRDKHRLGQHQAYCFYYARRNKPCYRWNCLRKECRIARRWSEEKRLKMGVEKILAQGDSVWFLTVEAANPQEKIIEPGEISNYQKSVSALMSLIKRLSKKARVNTLLCARVSGVKSANAASPHQLHSHIIVSWVPDPEPDPSKKHAHHCRSETLEENAAKLGLKVWLEKAYSPYQVATYLSQ
jgi:hypothetical protein